MTIRRRTRLLILKSFQIRYISLILLLLFSAALLTGYTVYYTTWVMFGEKLAVVYPQGLLLEIIGKVNTVLLLRLLFISPLVILIGLVLSNRIAGPIYRIQRFIKKIQSGDYTGKLKLRDKDELQDLAATVNSLVSKLEVERKARLEKMDAAISEIDSLLDETRSKGGQTADLEKRLLVARENLKDARG